MLYEYLAERRNQYLLGFFNMIVVYGIFKTESKRKSVPEFFIYQRISDGYSVGRTISTKIPVNRVPYRNSIKYCR